MRAARRGGGGPAAVPRRLCGSPKMESGVSGRGGKWSVPAANCAEDSRRGADQPPRGSDACEGRRWEPPEKKLSTCRRGSVRTLRSWRTATSERW